MLHEVILYREKGEKDPVTLIYLEETLGRSQTRFKNRTTLTPQIDLGAYRCAALVDWIDIEFQLSRRTQYWHLNDRIEKKTGRKEFPEALDLGEGRTASRYKLRVQEPDLESVRKVLEDLESEYGLATPPRIVGIEISVDFYPKSPSEETRARMHGVLIRHLFPTTRVLRSNRMWPRFTPGSIKSTDYTISRNESDDSLDIGDRMSPGLDRIVLYGSTYYVGERDDPRAFWRVQNKVLDKQNKAAGTKDELPEDKKRVRIEVTLGSEGCREIGLHKFSDLETLRVTHLQKSFFQFMKPTLAVIRPSAVHPASMAIKRKVEEYRRERFLKAGVLGLQIREDAKQELRALEMPTIKKLHRRNGTKIPVRVRTGSGAYGTMVVYEELTRMVERALAGLQRKVRREMGVQDQC
ncbi:MAG: hypothetical protein CTR54_03935 [Rhizobium sp.]|nr:MAG: hypothetical protein CTR54_03935 [Rhizobium sp.]